jgi:hypothetical protein
LAGRDLAGQAAEVGRDERFAGHAALGILGQAGVEDAVGNLIGQLIRVTAADRFTGKQKLAACHALAPRPQNRETAGRPSAGRRPDYT